MSRMPIAWHEECLKNLESSLEEGRHRLTQVRADVDNMFSEVELRKRQIREAKIRRMDSFDRDRLLIKRIPKS